MCFVTCTRPKYPHFRAQSFDFVKMNKKREKRARAVSLDRSGGLVLKGKLVSPLTWCLCFSVQFKTMFLCSVQDDVPLLSSRRRFSVPLTTTFLCSVQDDVPLFRSRRRSSVMFKTMSWRPGKPLRASRLSACCLALGSRVWFTAWS